jgi:hypothetical protein
MATSNNYRARVQSPEPREVTDYYESMQDNGSRKRSKFVHKIRAIRQTSTHYMTELHAEKVVKVVPRLRLEKIRVRKEF